MVQRLGSFLLQFSRHHPLLLGFYRDERLGYGNRWSVRLIAKPSHWDCGAVQAARITLVGERNFLEVCAVAVRRAQVCAGSETQSCGLRPNGEPTTFCGSHACLLSRRLSLGRVWRWNLQVHHAKGSSQLGGDLSTFVCM